MIPKNLFWLYREIAHLEEQLLLHGECMTQKKRQSIKNKISYRMKKARKIHERLQKDVSSMKQYRSLGKKGHNQEPPF